MFTNLLDLELERRGYRTTQQKADVCEVGYETMRKILHGKSHFADDRIIEIAKKIGVKDEIIAEMLVSKIYDKASTPEQRRIVATAIKNMKEKKPAQVGDEPAYIPEEKHTIPVYSSIIAGNSEMGITDGQPTGDVISIDDEYKKMGVFAMKISGDSMADDLYDGEIAIFKPINGEALRDKDIFAVEVEGWSSWSVKYVREDPSGIIQLISKNQAYPVREINPKVSQVILRGRLIESRRIRK